MRTITSICVFCGAASGRDARFRAGAEIIGRRIAEAGYRLVFGGGNAGLMGALCDAALAAGGEVVGVIPGFLVEREHAHRGVSRLITVDSMHSRKEKMFELSDAFIVLPGGVGTLDETLEIITWKQLGMHDKPIIIVNDGGYWSAFDALIAHMETEGFVGADVRRLYQVVDNVDQVLEALEAQPGSAIDTDTARL